MSKKELDTIDKKILRILQDDLVFLSAIDLDSHFSQIRYPPVQIKIRLSEWLPRWLALLQQGFL